ncbi:MAG: hypothetical protein KIT22_03025 [Verrucomicrobiae bacterium]|nr:hypothetical protein [Verrucomicrobiae bacterium]
MTILDEILGVEPDPELTFAEMNSALTGGLKNTAPERRARTIAIRFVALCVRLRAGEFAHMSQAEAAGKLGVTPSAISRAGDRSEEHLAVFRRQASQRA